MDLSKYGGLLGTAGGLASLGLGFTSSWEISGARDRDTRENDILIAQQRKRQEELLARQRADEQAAADRLLAESQAATAQSQSDFDNLALMQLLATAGLAQPAVANPFKRRRQPTNRTGPLGDTSMLNTGTMRLLGN